MRRCVRLFVSAFMLFVAVGGLSGCAKKAVEGRPGARRVARALNDSAMVLFHDKLFRPAGDTVSYRRIVGLLSQAISADSTYRLAYMNKYNVLLQMGRRRAARRLLEKWLKRHPEDRQVRFLLAVLYSSLDKEHLAERNYRRALKGYEAAIKSHPDSLSLYANYAYLLALMGKKSQALAELDSLLEARPADASAIQLIRDALARSDREDLVSKLTGSGTNNSFFKR